MVYEISDFCILINKLIKKNCHSLDIVEIFLKTPDKMFSSHSQSYLIAVLGKELRFKRDPNHDFSFRRVQLLFLVCSHCCLDIKEISFIPICSPLYLIAVFTFKYESSKNLWKWFCHRSVIEVMS